MMTALWGGGVVLAASGACRSRLGLEVSAEWGEGVMITTLWAGAGASRLRGIKVVRG